MPIRLRSRASSTLALGQEWILDVRVTDGEGCPVADTLTFTVTDPDEQETVLDAADQVSTSTGLYRVPYLPDATGRYVARVEAAEHGAAAFTAWVQAITTGAQLPDISELDTYLGANGASDDELQEALDAQAAAQRARCRMPATYDADLRSALLRRCARHLALKRIPLAMLGADSEAGPTTVPGRDPLVRELEGPWLKLGMG
jgi:hypothetical protein